MVLPGGSEHTAPDDLRQLAAHDAARVAFPGRTGPLAALDTGEVESGTVLLVAGYTGSKEDFAPLLTPIADAGLRAVAIDQRGQFESPGPEDPAPYSVAELAADVLAVGRQLREQSPGPLHLLGHSFGGIVSRAAVLAEPGLFDTLTLLGSGPAALTGPRAELLEHLSPLLDAGGVQLVNDTLEQLAMTDPRAQAVPAPTQEFLRRRFLANSAAGLRGMADAMLGEPDRVAELAASGVPVLVAHGIADDAWSPAAQADMAQRLGARHEVIVHAVHSPAIENPERTLQVLLSFWSDPVAAAAADDDQTEAAR
ncbi:alpha/beta fold hydrolase [Modestobacter versicolor]|uniref:Alpha/beta hydrolase n=1 Tax=Modestobacter versicolor TaxID=429133 RepID=A0A323VSL4_9ACTN|nr:alpha/beta hydrolase [Modestobacter versicolor]MBB3678663.1 pimeloyl-ACP methyl ester carboxylesterase [Modestobacter versicolor]PZA22038.1 alpha/beta hydrolase [Modestobacter versicolor]